MKTLYKCRTYGVATRIPGMWATGMPMTTSDKKKPVYRCADTSECAHRRDFGGMSYCSDNLLREPIEKKPKEAKQ